MTTKIQSVRVAPVHGRTILMPERSFQPVPATGARVYLDAFYARAIAQGDLQIVPDVPASAPAVVTKAIPAAPEPAPVADPALAGPVAFAPIPVSQIK